MTECVITSSVLIAVVIALRFLFRKKISQWLQYALWGLVLLRLLMPFSLFTSPFSIMNAVDTAQIRKSMSDIKVYSDMIRNTDMSPDEARAVGNGTLHEIQRNSVERGYGNLKSYIFTDSLDIVLGRVFRTIWLVGIITAGLWFVVTNLVFYRKLRKTRVAYSVTDCRLPVYIADGFASPCLFGILRPSIYLTPKTVETENSTRHVLTHEMCHYCHGDHIWSILRGLCLTAYWWNPLVWAAAILSREDSELACDEAVIRRIGEENRLAYGHTLIDMIAVRKATTGLIYTATTMVSGKRGIKVRLNMIVKNLKTVIPAMVAVLLIIAVSVGCTFTRANATPLSAEEALEQLTASVAHLDGQVSFQIPEGYKKPEEWNIHIAGRQEFEDDFSQSVHLLEDVNEAKAWEPGKQYTIDINDAYTELTLTAFLPGENGETLEKSIDLLNTSTSAAFPAVDMVFLSDSTDLKQIGRDAAAFYYSQFMEDDIPHYWHITKYEILSCELTAGDKKEFAVWITSYIETDDYGFLVGQGIPNDPDNPTKGGICPEVGRELRIKALDNGKYEIVSIGTGGGAQGLTPYASQQTTLEPIAPGWSSEQSIGADMTSLDYASDEIVIFHGYFGMFVYNLDSHQIIRSLDLKPLKCDATQGDDYCEVSVSIDGNTVQLHPMSSENMYIYTVSDNTLLETAYQSMENSFGNQFVPITDVKSSTGIGNYSFNAIRFDTGEYGYLHTSDWTLGTLSYVRDDMMYALFDINTNSIYTEEEIQAAMDCVRKYFSEVATSRVLNDLWFDEEACATHRTSYMQYGKGKINGVSEKNVIVLLCNFTIENDETFKGYYPNWQMILIRDSADGAWRIDDQGY